MRDAYQKLTRRFHPDAVGEVPVEQTAKVHAIFMRVSEAFNALRTTAPEACRPLTPRTPTAVAQVSSAPVAEPALSREEILTKAEEALAEWPWEALAAAERILPAASGPLRQRARLLQARANLKNPITWRAGELELREIQQEDPALVDAALLLAFFYKDRGLTARAVSLFRKVLEQKPGHRRATDELRSLPLAGPVSLGSGRWAAARA